MQYFCSIRLLFSQNTHICSQNYHRSRQKKHIIWLFIATIVTAIMLLLLLLLSPPLCHHHHCCHHVVIIIITAVMLLLLLSPLLPSLLLLLWSPLWLWLLCGHCIMVVVGLWLGWPQVCRQGG